MRTRDDVIATAGRMFAERGYEGTSMRDLGREMGLLGSSLYSHIGSKQDLLVEVVARGAALFEASAAAATTRQGTGRQRLRALISGHLDVVLDHRDEVRTFLSEARSLDGTHRSVVLDQRNRYEQVFRQAIAEGVKDTSLPKHLDPVIAAIFLLSILNAVDRWFSEGGRLDRAELTDAIMHFAGLD